MVALEEGTANFADIIGYDVGGKTGTALKIIDGVYSNKSLTHLCHYFRLVDLNMSYWSYWTNQNQHLILFSVASQSFGNN